jgi:hypothetical protein
MDPISNADRLVRLLRQRLEERSKAGSSDAAKPALSVQARSVDATKKIAGRLAREGGANAILRRALIEQLLADQFGVGILNEAKFQQLVDRVETAMEDDPQVSNLLGNVLLQLKGAA